LYACAFARISLHAAVDLLLRTGQREVCDARRIDGDVPRGEIGNDSLRGGHDFDAGGAEPVRDGGGATAGGGHDRDAMTGSGFPPAHQGGQLEQRVQLINAQHAVRAEERAGRLVRSGHGAGVRGRKLAAYVGAPELVDDDRFAGRRRAVRRRGEVIRIAYGFHEEQDHLGVRVVHQHAGDLADRETRLVTDRYQPGEADAAPVAARWR
jgi:hypothetical protein